MTPKRDEKWEEKLRSEITYNDETCEITFNGDVIGTWNDEANCNYPEDLTWSRTIGSLVTDCSIATAHWARRQAITEVIEALRSEDLYSNYNARTITACRELLEERFKE